MCNEPRPIQFECRHKPPLGLGSCPDLRPLILALILGAVVLVISGHNPLTTYKLLATESFGSMKRVGATLAAATPLIFTGLATAIAFRTGAFNVGVEGCVNVGGLAAAFVGFTFVSLSGFVLLPAAIIASVIAGALWMLVPALLKSRLNVDEVVTTLMLNFVPSASRPGWSKARCWRRDPRIRLHRSLPKRPGFRS